MIRIEDIIENKLYSFLTQQNEDYFYFNDKDEQSIWVTAFNVNEKSSSNIVFERFWLRKRNFSNEVYAQGSEATSKEKEKLIKNILKLNFLEVGVN